MAYTLAEATRRSRFGLILRKLTKKEYEEYDWKEWRENFKPLYPVDDTMCGMIFNPTLIKEQYNDDQSEYVFFIDFMTDEEIKLQGLE